MAKIAYILLCHKDPDAIIGQAERLTAAGDCVAIHFDARSRPEDDRRLRTALAGNPNIAFPARRVRCGWGEWSLVQATLNTLNAALDAFPRATHFYMLSGDCMPIKSAEYIHRHLDDNDVDFIESVDFFDGGWIKTGIREERLTYRHFFNERKSKRLFYAALRMQKSLGLSRPIPPDLQIQIGSQWWCLRRRTVEGIAEFVRSRPDVLRFFRTTWIPDETFFQTLVRHLVPETEIRSRTPTFLMFSDYGMPVSFYNDHYDLLLGQDYLFARKISPEAHALKTRLGELYASTGARFEISDEGRQLHAFLTGRGRVGRSFARRFWETQGTIGSERELMILVCKKWHVGKRLASRIREVAGVTAMDYLFNEDTGTLPELGGIQSTLKKRDRHRRALMRMLYEYFDTDRMVICADPGSLDLLHDFFSDRCETRMLEIECRFSDADLIGHARRVGLAGAHPDTATRGRLLPAIRNDIAHEAERIREAGFSRYHRIHEGDAPDALAGAVGGFLGVSPERAREIVGTGAFFAD